MSNARFGPVMPKANACTPITRTPAASRTSNANLNRTRIYFFFVPFQVCEAGTFSSLPGSTACTECREGKFTASSGQTACKFCAPGNPPLPDPSLTLVLKTRAIFFLTVRRIQRWPQGKHMPQMPRQTHCFQTRTVFVSGTAPKPAIALNL